MFMGKNRPETRKYVELTWNTRKQPEICYIYQKMDTKYLEPTQHHKDLKNSGINGSEKSELELTWTRPKL